MTQPFVEVWEATQLLAAAGPGSLPKAWTQFVPGWPMFSRWPFPAQCEGLDHSGGTGHTLAADLQLREQESHAKASESQ